MMSTPKAILSLLSAAFVCILLYLYFSKETAPPKVYTIGIDESWYPFQLYDKKQDITEFSEALLKAIEAKETFSFRLLPVTSEYLFSGFDNGEYDGILSSLSNFEENTDKYIVSQPYYLLGPVLVVPASSEIKSIHDLNNKYIGMIKDSIPFSSLYKNGMINPITYDYSKYSDLIKDIMDQKIDGAILNTMTAYEITKSGLYSNQLKIVSKQLTQEGLYLMVKKDSDSSLLIKKFDEGLNTLKKEGVYKKLLLQWGLYEPEHPQQEK